MKIAPVKKNHLNRRALELLRGIQAGKAASQDENSVFLCRHRWEISLNMLRNHVTHGDITCFAAAL